MSGGLQLRRQMSYANDGNALGNSLGLALAEPASGNTYSAWTQVIGAAPFDCDGITVVVSFGTSSNHAGKLDIGIGAAGSESAKIQGLIYQFGSGAGTNVKFDVPLKIRAGSRIAARNLWLRDNPQTVYLSVSFYGGGFESGETYQQFALLADQVPCTTGSAANTKGSWTQLLASLPSDFAKFLAVISVAGAVADLGVGPAGSEQVIAPNLIFGQGWAPSPNQGYWIDKPLPAGSRIAARGQGPSASYSFDVSLYGMN